MTVIYHSFIIPPSPSYLLATKSIITLVVRYENIKLYECVHVRQIIQSISGNRYPVVGVGGIAILVLNTWYRKNPWYYVRVLFSTVFTKACGLTVLLSYHWFGFASTKLFINLMASKVSRHGKICDIKSDNNVSLKFTYRRYY